MIYILCDGFVKKNILSLFEPLLRKIQASRSRKHIRGLTLLKSAEPREIQSASGGSQYVELLFFKGVTKERK